VINRNSSVVRQLADELGIPWSEAKGLSITELNRLRTAYERGFAAGQRTPKDERPIRTSPPELPARDRLGDAMGRAAAYWIQEKGRPNGHIFYIPGKELRVFIREIHSRTDAPVRSGFGVPHPSRITVVLKRHLNVMVPMMKRLLKGEPKLTYDTKSKQLCVLMPTGWKFPARTT